MKPLERIASLIPEAMALLLASDRAEIRAMLVAKGIEVTAEQADKLIAEDESYEELQEIARIQGTLAAIIQVFNEEHARRTEWERGIEAELRGAG